MASYAYVARETGTGREIRSGKGDDLVGRFALDAGHFDLDALASQLLNDKPLAGKTGTAEYFRDWNKDGKPDRDQKPSG